ncbi:ATP-binding protein [Roseisolibacter sp. H3M3-2]|uniref:ATP-binding protein n=1 Tax=Roseisolibacter sp. H3M3-2 TaxID=3031323 RepID=UPI0023DA0CF6|nr:ATP-binding protein [Roseisolibacter sp. H3M3-2]MDF1504472.1 response regulator [Roseisolibacter sp. H3M3-2]
MRGQLVLLVMMALTPFLALAALRANERAARARQATEERVLSAARQVRWRVEDRVHNIRAMLVATAHTVRVDPAAVAANDSVLRAIRDGLGDVEAVTNLWVHDRAGANVGTSLRPLPDRASVAAGDRRYFRDLLRTGRAAVGDPVRARGDTSFWTVTFAEPVRDRDGALRGAVLGTVRLRSLARTLVQAGLPAGASATLVDANGVVLGGTGADSLAIGRALATARAAAPAEGVGEVTADDGTRLLVAHTRLPGLGWRVHVAMPRRAALVDVESEIRRDVLLALLTLVVSLGLALAVARRLVQPLEALAEDAQRLAAGEPPGPARHAATGELETLAEAFHEMAATIAARTAALHRSEQRHRLMFDASPLPIYMVDLETYRFLAVNDAAVAQYGWSRAEFAELTLLDIRPPEERLRFLSVARSLGMAQSFNDRANAGVWRHLRRDGTTMEVEIFTAITEHEGRPARLSVAIDVTARRLAERALQESQEQLRRAQKMEALGRFAGGIAHDFNNLLTGILGYCDLALLDLPDGAPEREDFQAIRLAAQRAAGLTGQILAFSRGQVVQPVPLDLNEVLAGLEPMLGRMIGEHIRLVTARAPALGAVLADPGQVEQIVVNLALNARDAMPEGGLMSLATRDERVEAHDPTHPGVPAGRWVVLELRDTGVGMDAETQARIFEPFFTTKERGKGTGLGLATVYGIVRQAGGTVRVRSAPGAGSTFTVYLPRAEAAAVEPRRAEAPAPPARGGSETVLLVEDEDAVRSIARETLARRGYEVLVAADGPAALALARRREAPIDLLLTDVVMPGMHGRALAEALLRDRPTLRVLFMSGYTEDEVLHRGVSTEALAFIAKPFTPDMLAARVRDVLDAGEGAPVLAAAGGGRD